MGNTNRRRPLSTTSILVLPLRAVAAAAAAAAASLEVAATITTISVPKMRPHLAANRRVTTAGGFGSRQLALSSVLQDDENRLFREEIVDSVSPLPGPASLQPRGSFRLF